MEIGTYGLIAAMLAVPAIGAVLYLAKNIKRLPDLWRLFTKRARCVLVHFRLRNNTSVDRYMIPDEHGMMFIDGGMYHYDQNKACFNRQKRMFEYTVYEGQFAGASGEIHEMMIDFPVTVTVDGVKKTEVKKVPQYVVNHAGLIPQKVILPAEKDDRGNIINPEEHLGAKELNDFSESHVSRDIMTATAQEMSFMKFAMILSGIACVLTLVVGLALYSKLSNIETALQTANAIRAATGK